MRSLLTLLFLFAILARAAAADPKPVGKIGTPSSGVYQLVFSPDGKVLAARYQDHTLRLWEVASGKELPEVQPGDLTEILRIIDFTADGKTLMTQEQGGRIGKTAQRFVYHRDVASGKVSRSFEVHSSRVAALPDRKTLVAGTGDGVAFLDSESGQVLRRLNLLALSPAPAVPKEHQGKGRTYSDSTHYFTLASNGKTMLWTNTWHDPVDSKGPILPLVITCHVVDVATGKEVSRLETEADMRFPEGHDAFGFSSDGKTIVGCPDYRGLRARTFRLWDAATGRPRGQFRTGALLTYRRWGVEWLFTPDDRGLFTISSYGNVRAWDLASGKETMAFNAFNDDSGRFAQCLALSPDGKLLASGSQDGVIYLWSLAEKGQREQGGQLTEAQAREKAAAFAHEALKGKTYRDAEEKEYPFPRITPRFWESAYKKMDRWWLVTAPLTGVTVIVSFKLDGSDPKLEEATNAVE